MLKLDNPIAVQQLDGLTVWYVPVTSAIDPSELFPDDTPEQQADLICKLENYHWVLFDARVFVTPTFDTNIVLGEAYLGGCLYTDYDKIVPELGDLGLIDDAIEEAKVTYNRLMSEVALCI